MAAAIIDGQQISKDILEELKAETAALKAQGVQPGLAVVLVGDDPASQVYVRKKIEIAESLGIHSESRILPASITQEELFAAIDGLNADPAIHGILVQSPVPPPLDERAAFNRVLPGKDVDGLHPFNAGALLQGGTPMPPCTPKGCIELLKRTGVEISGKEAVVVGRSDLVGKPVAALLLHENATVTICHSRTRDLPSVCRRADILVVAIGRPRMITGDYVKEGAVVLDVGINRVDGKLVGDVDFASVSQKASAITPVPRGVGPMTVAMLMRNTITAARVANGLKV